MSQVSLVHPAIMFGLLGVSIYTGILGWNYRQARLIPVISAEHCCTAGFVFAACRTLKRAHFFDHVDLSSDAQMSLAG
jgi:hypothetical protein